MSYLLTLSSRLKGQAPVMSAPTPAPAPAPEPTVQTVTVPVVEVAPEPTPEPFLSVSESAEDAPLSTSQDEAPAELAAVETVPIVEEESSSD